MANPILLKEFIQGAHRSRTYVLRTALPLAAVTVVLASVGAFWYRLGTRVFDQCMLRGEPNRPKA